MREQMAQFIGLDLGQAADFTALAVLERPRVASGGPAGLRRPVYSVRYLQRFPLGTTYPEIVQLVLEVLLKPALRGAVIAVDQTGVGRAVVEMLVNGLRHQSGTTLIPIQITGGNAVTTGEDGSFRVPKKTLVRTIHALLQARRLQIARTLPSASLLVKEMKNFRVKITESRNEAFEARGSGQHDDLLLAILLAAWVAEQGLPPLIAGHFD